MNYLAIEENTLQHLQSFQSVDEMNDQIKWYKTHYQLSKTDCHILNAISRYACKYVGVCFLNKQKIAEEAGFKSRRTAIRSCQRLEQLGIIKQYETRRVNGDKRQSANIIVILRHEANVKYKCTQHKENDKHLTCKSHRKVTRQCHTIKTTYKTHKKTVNIIDTYKDTTDLTKRGLKSSIPSPIYHAFSPFFDGEALYYMYGILLRAKAKLNVMFLIEDYADRYIDVFYNSIRLYKLGKIDNLANYLYVAWERLTAEIDRQIVQQTMS